jgi:putative tryptophan/tyrosine transport system substrate-binding protein
VSLFDLTGKAAIVTGSSRGIGRAIVERMAEHGGRSCSRRIGRKPRTSRRQVIASLVRVALLFNPNNASNIITRDEIETATRDLGMNLVRVEVSTVSDLDTKLSGVLSQRPDALITTADAFLISQIPKIIDFLENNRIPGMFVDREYVLAGGLMSYGASIPDSFRRGATYVHKILQGTKPSDLPVEQPTKFDLVLNLKTAKTLGLTFPQTLIATADEIVE